MGSVQFNEDGEYGGRIVSSMVRSGKRVPTLVRLLIKAGLSQRTAELTLIGILVGCSFITFFVIKTTFFPGSSGAPTYLEDIPKEIRDTLSPEVLREIPSRPK